MTGFARFNKQWASTGATLDPTDTQANAGFAFLGATPPSVELFNALLQDLDDKDNNLYEWIAAVLSAASITPADATPGQLLAAIKKLDAHLAPASASSTHGVSLTAGYNASVTVSLTAPVAGFILAIGSLNTSSIGTTAIAGVLQFNGSGIVNDATTMSQSLHYIQPIGAGATATIAYNISCAANTGTLGTYYVTAIFIPYP